MQDKPQWPPYLAIENHPGIKLPPRPGVKRLAVIDCCPFCQLPHFTMATFTACKEMHK